MIIEIEKKRKSYIISLKKLTNAFWFDFCDIFQIGWPCTINYLEINPNSRSFQFYSRNIKMQMFCNV